MKNITQNNITFLSDIDKKFEINKSEKYYYFNVFNYTPDHIYNFISQIRDNEIILIFPFLTTTEDLKDPYLRLSNQFLVNNQSNPALIARFLEDQWFTSDFYNENDNQFFLYFKYKKVYIKSTKL
jgi:predicted nucleotide-binding protein (sugar kinase/HSP70/actin superfamily)